MNKFSLALMTMLVPVSAFAAEMQMDSEIGKVTVFPDRADVSRFAKINLPQGKHTLVFDRLPAGLITPSLRVSGKGSNAFTIGSVETKEVFTPNLAVADEKKIESEILALRDKRRFVEAEIKAADTGKAFLENLTHDKSLPVAAADTKKTTQTTPEMWKSAWQTIKDGMIQLGKESVEKQISLRDIDAKIESLLRQKGAYASGMKSFKQVRVNIEADKPVRADLTLQYQIRGASWEPLYEARLHTGKEKVEIVQYGNISQRTGEDWTNVALTVSTATPSVTMTPPALTPVWVNLRPQMPETDLRSPRKAERKMRSFAAANFTQGIQMDAAVPMMAKGNLTEEAVYDTAKVSATDFSGVFIIKGQSNVPADGAKYRFNIATYNLPAEIRAEAVPSADPAAYLMATSIFNGELPLLAGDVALFRDRDFIGNSFMTMLRPKEKLHLSFGQDEKIRVVYTPLGGETSEGGVINRDTQKDVKSVTEVQNLHKTPIKITLYDYLPIARNGDITVKIIKADTTAGYVEGKDNKIGTVKWESVYQPQEKKKIGYAYSVSYPKDRILTGL